jgi:hypothetical protein
MDSESLYEAYEEGFKEGIKRAKQELMKLYNELLTTEEKEND